MSSHNSNSLKTLYAVLTSVLLWSCTQASLADLVISPTSSYSNYRHEDNNFVISPIKQPYEPRLTIDQSDKRFCQYLQRHYHLRRGIANYRSQEAARGAQMRYTWICDKGKTQYISSSSSKLGRSYFKPR